MKLSFFLYIKIIFFNYQYGSGCLASTRIWCKSPKWGSWSKVLSGDFGGGAPNGGLGTKPPVGVLGAKPPNGGLGAKPPAGVLGAELPNGGVGGEAPNITT